MPTDFDKYEELEQEIAQLLETLPKSASSMTDEQLAKLWDLINKQRSYIELLKDQPRL